MSTSETPLEAIDIVELDKQGLRDGQPTTLAAGLLRLRRRGEAMTQPRAMLVIGGVLMPAGVALVVAGWFGASHTTRLFEEVPYLISGGILGLAVVVLGCAFYFGYWQTRIVDQQRDVLDVLERIEARLAVGGTTNGSGPATTVVALVATAAGSLYHRLDCPVVDGRPAKELVPVALPTDRAPCRLCHPPH